MNNESKQDENNLFDVLVNASSFQAAAEILNNNLKDDGVLVWPIMVNQALSLELYLKCLLNIRKKKFANTHNTKKLFAILSEGDRQSITKYYDEQVYDPDIKKQLPVEMDMSLEAVLQRSCDIFERGRYWHEGKMPSRDDDGKASNAGVDLLIIAVRNLIFDIHPNWRERRFAFRFAGATDSRPRTASVTE